MAFVKIKNTSGEEGTWLGQTLADEATYDIPTAELTQWADDQDVFDDVANGNLTINDGVNDITDTLDGWKILTGTQQMPVSDIDNFKLAVHTSYKPKSDNTTYAVWTGAGDDMAASPSGLGAGPLLHFDMMPQTGSPYVQQDISINLEFDPAFGKIWVHEGYLQFQNGGCGDYIDSDVIARGSAVQTAANKILVIENNWIKYAVGSPNPATHGWAGTPTLIPRSYSMDGDWDYDGTTLTPNLNGTGGYKISDIERVVHRYFNRIPCCGTSPYFSMTSDETTELPEGYYIRITAHNVSNTTWMATVMIEIYRERTYLP